LLFNFFIRLLLVRKQNSAGISIESRLRPAFIFIWKILLLCYIDDPEIENIHWDRQGAILKPPRGAPFSA